MCRSRSIAGWYATAMASSTLRMRDSAKFLLTRVTRALTVSPGIPPGTNTTKPSTRATLFPSAPKRFHSQRDLIAPLHHRRAISASYCAMRRSSSSDTLPHS